jgi:large subunit ribosomal protein L29
MTIKEIRELPSEEILNEVKKSQAKIFKLRFQGKGKDLENPGEYKMARKDIARMHTVLRERELGARGGTGK